MISPRRAFDLSRIQTLIDSCVVESCIFAGLGNRQGRGVSKK